MQGLAVTGRNTSTSNIMTMTNSDARRFLYVDTHVQKIIAHFHSLLKEIQGRHSHSFYETVVNGQYENFKTMSETFNYRRLPISLFRLFCFIFWNKFL